MPLCQPGASTAIGRMRSRLSLTTRLFPLLECSNFLGQASPGLQQLVNAPAIVPASTNSNAVAKAAAAKPNVKPAALGASALLTKLQAFLSTPLIPLLLQAVNDLLQLIAKIQTVLFTLPGVNLLSVLFYRVCAESATQSRFWATCRR